MSGGSQPINIMWLKSTPGVKRVATARREINKKITAQNEALHPLKVNTPKLNKSMNLFVKYTQALSVGNDEEQ